MRAYKVLPTKGANPDGSIKPVYAGSQSDAATAKKAMQEKHDLKRTDVAVNPVEIPTDKTGLITWLNAL